MKFFYMERPKKFYTRHPGESRGPVLI